MGEELANRKAVSLEREEKLGLRAARRLIKGILRGDGIDPHLFHRFMNYNSDSALLSAATRAAVVTTWVGAAIAILGGSLFAAYPDIPAAIMAALPSWSLSRKVHDVFNYLHSVHNSRVETAHFIYHIPDLGFDLALFSPLYGLAARVFVNFGWRRHLPMCKSLIRRLLETGKAEAGDAPYLFWRMKPDYTAFIVGDGDPLADEFVHNKPPDRALLFATTPQQSSAVWAHLDTNTGIKGLAEAFKTANFENCGRMVILPVQAQHMVFPPNNAYDIAPDKVDDLIRNIRALDRKISTRHGSRREPVKIIVVGDKKQSTTINTYDPVTHQSIPGESATINLETISAKYAPDVVVIDPTELVMKRIADLARGATLVFRGTHDSQEVYEGQFIVHLKEMLYSATDAPRTVNIGYNITDDPTVADPMNAMAVILTAGARDALLEKGFPRDRILFVPEMVIHEMEALLAGSGEAPRHTDQEIRDRLASAN